MASLQYGLNIKKKGLPSGTKVAEPKRRTLFDDDLDNEDDGSKEDPRNDGEEISVFNADADPASNRSTTSKSAASAPTALKPPSRPINSAKSTIDQDLSTIRTQKQRQADAEALDSNIYDYDAAYDALHAQSAAKKAAERADALQRKPKYMDKLIAAADLRKRDQLRAEDRARQRERQAEGDDFKDTEEFVTEGYKKQQEELRKVEEEERANEQKEAERRKKSGMGGFYRKVMEEEEHRHAEAVEAAKRVNKGGITQDDALQEDQNEELNAADLAKELNARGANIDVNEEGQVTDKRQLLSAGLNIATKRKADGSTVIASAVAQRPVQREDHRSRAAEDGKRAARERQARMIEAQLEQAAKKAAEAEAEERARVERSAKSKKTQDETLSAKERYLQRKREAAAAAATGQS